MTRRNLIRASLGAGVGVSRASPHPIRLGAPVLGKYADPRDLARAHRALGYSAAFCPRDAKAADAAATRAIEQAFAAEDVVIAEVGAFRNMLEQDPGKRRENLAWVAERLELAEAVGARCCVNIPGSFNTKIWYGPHPRNMSREFVDATVENCRKLIDDVKPKRTKFTIEMSGWSLPNDPDSYLRLIRAVDRAGFGVHLDVCNGINSPQRFYQNATFTTECFRKLGRWIESCHAKDLDWQVAMQLHFVEVVPGRGSFDYRTFLRELAGLPRPVPMLLEHLRTTEEYQEGKRYIAGVAGELRLALA